MIPLYTRVAAIDDNEDHLRKIVWGLGRAGFCPIPFHFDDGKLEPEPAHPLPGLRLVFTDIHLIGGGDFNQNQHAAVIVRCLKKIVGSGPYALIFWSQFPGDADPIAARVAERAIEAGLSRPVGYATIEKGLVFKLDPKGGDDEFDAAKLREIILDRIRGFKTLAVAAAWEERAAQAAARTTNRLFDLVRSSDQPADDWECLLAYLASEAVGEEQAKLDLTNALDSALLPLLEDQLGVMGGQPAASAEDMQRLRNRLDAEGGAVRPACTTISHLNSSYLIDETEPGDGSRMWHRGMVFELGSGFINSGPFISAFRHEASDLIWREFVTTSDKTNFGPEQIRKARLHVVELGPECDHVQGKVATHRYLLSVLVPSELIWAFNGRKAGKTSGSIRYANDSVVDVGEIALRDTPDTTWHLLVSCRSFMTLAAQTEVQGRCRFRLRRSTLEEVAHRSATHARRPGVMRFFST